MHAKLINKNNNKVYYNINYDDHLDDYRNHLSTITIFKKDFCF